MTTTTATTTRSMVAKDVAASRPDLKLIWVRHDVCDQARSVQRLLDLFLVPGGSCSMWPQNSLLYKSGCDGLDALYRLLAPALTDFHCITGRTCARCVSVHHVVSFVGFDVGTADANACCRNCCFDDYHHS